MGGRRNGVAVPAASTEQNVVSVEEDQDEEFHVNKRRSARQVNRKQRAFEDDEDVAVDSERVEDDASDSENGVQNKTVGDDDAIDSEDEITQDDIELIEENTGVRRPQRAAWESARSRKKPVQSIKEIEKELFEKDDENDDDSDDGDDDDSDGDKEKTWEEFEDGEGNKEFCEIFGCTVRDFEKKQPGGAKADGDEDEDNDDEQSTDAEDSIVDDDPDSGLQNLRITDDTSDSVSAEQVVPVPPVVISSAAAAARAAKIANMPGRVQQMRFNPDVTDAQLQLQAEWTIRQQAKVWQSKQPQVRLLSETIRVLDLMHRENLEPDTIYWYNQSDADPLEPENVKVRYVREARAPKVQQRLYNTSPKKKPKKPVLRRRVIVEEGDGDEEMPLAAANGEPAASAAAAGGAEPVANDTVIIDCAPVDAETGQDADAAGASVGDDAAAGDSDMVEPRYHWENSDPSRPQDQVDSAPAANSGLQPSLEVGSTKSQQPPALIGGGWDDVAEPTANQQQAAPEVAFDLGAWDEVKPASSDTAGNDASSMQQNPTNIDLFTTLQSTSAVAVDPTLLGGQNRSRFFSLDDIKDIWFLNTDYQTIETEKRRVRIKVHNIRMLLPGLADEQRSKVEQLLPADKYIDEVPSREAVDDLEKNMSLLNDWINPTKYRVTKSGHKRRIRQTNAATKSGWVNYAQAKRHNIDNYFSGGLFGDWKTCEAMLITELTAQAAAEKARERKKGASAVADKDAVDAAAAAAEKTTSSDGAVPTQQHVKKRHMPTLLNRIDKFIKEHKLDVGDADQLELVRCQTVNDAMQTAAHEICTRPRIRREMRNFVRDSRAARIVIIKSPREGQKQIDEELSFYTRLKDATPIGALSRDDIIRIQCGVQRKSLQMQWPEVKNFLTTVLYRGMKGAAYKLYDFSPEGDAAVVKATAVEAASEVAGGSGAGDACFSGSSVQQQKPTKQTKKVLNPVILKNYGREEDVEGFTRSFLAKNNKKRSAKNNHNNNNVGQVTTTSAVKRRLPISVATWSHLRTYSAMLATLYLSKTLCKQMWDHVYNDAVANLFREMALTFRGFISSQPLLNVLEKVAPSKLHYYDTEPEQNMSAGWYNTLDACDSLAARYNTALEHNAVVVEEVVEAAGGGGAAAVPDDPWGAAPPPAANDVLHLTAPQPNDGDGEKCKTDSNSPRTCVMGVMLEDEGSRGRFAATVVDKFGQVLGWVGPFDIKLGTEIQLGLAHSALLGLAKKFRPILIVVSGTGPLAADVVANLKFLRQGRLVAVSESTFWPKLDCAVQLARADIASCVQTSMLTRSLTLGPNLLNNDLALGAWSLCLESVEPCLPYALLFDEKDAYRYIRNMHILYDQYREELKPQGALLMKRLESEMVSLVATRGLTLSECRVSSYRSVLARFLPGFALENGRENSRLVAFYKAISSSSNDTSSRASMRTLSHMMQVAGVRTKVHVFPSDAVYRNAIAFLRMRKDDAAYRIDDAVEPHEIFDQTRIHPDMYDLACTVVKAAFRLPTTSSNNNLDFAGLTIGELLSRIEQDPSLLAKRDLVGVARNLLNTGDVAAADLWKVQFILNELCYPYREMRPFPGRMPSWDDLYFWCTGARPEEHVGKTRFTATVQWVQHDPLIRRNSDGTCTWLIRNVPAEINQKIVQANSVRRELHMKDWLCPYCHRPFQSSNAVGTHIRDTLQFWQPRLDGTPHPNNYVQLAQERALCVGSFRIAVLQLHNGFPGVIVRAVLKNTNTPAVNKLFTELELNRNVCVRVDEWSHKPSPNRFKICGNKQGQLTVLSRDETMPDAKHYLQELQSDKRYANLASRIDMQAYRDQRLRVRLNERNAVSVDVVNKNMQMLFMYGVRVDAHIKNAFPLSDFESSVRRLRLLLMNNVGISSYKKVSDAACDLLRMTAESHIRASSKASVDAAAKKYLYFVVPLLNYALVFWAYIMPKEYGDHVCTETLHCKQLLQRFKSREEYSIYARVQIDRFIIYWKYDDAQFFYYLPEHEAQSRLLRHAATSPRDMLNPSLVRTFNIIGYSSDLYQLIASAFDDRKAVFDSLIDNCKSKGYIHLHLSVAPELDYWPLFAIVKQLWLGSRKSADLDSSTSADAPMPKKNAHYCLTGRADTVNTTLRLLWAKRSNQIVSEPICVLTKKDKLTFKEADAEFDKLVADERRAAARQQQQQQSSSTVLKVSVIRISSGPSLTFRFRGASYAKLVDLLKFFKSKGNADVKRLFNENQIDAADDGDRVDVEVPEGVCFLGLLAKNEQDLYAADDDNDGLHATKPSDAVAAPVVDGWGAETHATTTTSTQQETLEGGWDADTSASSSAAVIAPVSAAPDGWLDDVPTTTQAAAAPVKPVYIGSDDADASGPLKAVLNKWLKLSLSAEEHAVDGGGKRQIPKKDAVDATLNVDSSTEQSVQTASSSSAVVNSPFDTIDLEDAAMLLPSGDGSASPQRPQQSEAMQQKSDDRDDDAQIGKDDDMDWRGVETQIAEPPLGIDDDDEGDDAIGYGQNDIEPMRTQDGRIAPAPMTEMDAFGAVIVRGGKRGGRGGRGGGADFRGGRGGGPRGRGRGRGGGGRGGGGRFSPHAADNNNSSQDAVVLHADEWEMASLAGEHTENSQQRSTQGGRFGSAMPRVNNTQQAASWGDENGDEAAADTEIDDGFVRPASPPQVRPRTAVPNVAANLVESDVTTTLDEVTIIDNSCPSRAGRAWTEQGANYDPVSANRLWHMDAEDVPAGTAITLASQTADVVELDEDGNEITPVTAGKNWTEIGPNANPATATRGWGAEHIPEIASRMGVPLVVDDADELLQLHAPIKLTVESSLINAALQPVAAAVNDWGDDADTNTATSNEYQFPAPPLIVQQKYNNAAGSDLASTSSNVDSNNNSQIKAAAVQPRISGANRTAAMVEVSNDAGKKNLFEDDEPSVMTDSAFAPPPKAFLEQLRRKNETLANAGETVAQPVSSQQSRATRDSGPLRGRREKQQTEAEQGATQNVAAAVDDDDEDWGDDVGEASSSNKNPGIACTTNPDAVVHNISGPPFPTTTPNSSSNNNTESIDSRDILPHIELRRPRRGPYRDMDARSRYAEVMDDDDQADNDDEGIRIVTFVTSPAPDAASDAAGSDATANRAVAAATPFPSASTSTGKPGAAPAGIPQSTQLNPRSTQVLLPRLANRAQLVATQPVSTAELRANRMQNRNVSNNINNNQPPAELAAAANKQKVQSVPVDSNDDDDEEIQFIAIVENNTSPNSSHALKLPPPVIVKTEPYNDDERRNVASSQVELSSQQKSRRQSSQKNLYLTPSDVARRQGSKNNILVNGTVPRINGCATRSPSAQNNDADIDIVIDDSDDDEEQEERSGGSRGKKRPLSGKSDGDDDEEIRVISGNGISSSMGGAGRRRRTEQAQIVYEDVV